MWKIIELLIITVRVGIIKTPFLQEYYILRYRFRVFDCNGSVLILAELQRTIKMRYVKVAPEVGISDLSADNPSLGVNYQYYNYTGRSIAVALRQGLTVDLPQLQHRTHTGIIVRMTFTMSPITLNSAARWINSIPENDLSLIQRAIKDKIKNASYHSSMVIYFDYKIPLTLLTASDGVMYVKDIDVLFFNGSALDAPYHPHTPHGELVSQATATEEDKNNFFFKVDLVDNENKVGDRYIYIQGKVYKVVARKDPQREDGVYFVRRGSTNEVNKADYYRDYWAFNIPLEELGLYRTEVEALDHGNSELTKKLELTELEHNIALEKKAAELDKIKADSEKRKQELEHSKMDFEEQLKRIKEKHQGELEHLKKEKELELEKLRTKEYYENRSYDRKDSSETMKFLPSFILGVGAVFLALKGIV
ncbi:MAG: hypothetical protein E6Q68_06170 [Polynucleobacter sp.]|nr:MAG: hypothetical protein E6Q68_06170 [Polynucleobacter sp.]